MKSKTAIPTPSISPEKTLGTRKKPKSLRPMRSMVAIKSLKPKTVVAGVKLQSEAH